MAETLETLTKRVTRLEKVIAEMTLQLSALVDVSDPVDPKNCKTIDEQQTSCITDKQREAQAIQKMREHLGIADIELMPLEELRKSMVSLFLSRQINACCELLRPKDFCVSIQKPIHNRC